MLQTSFAVLLPVFFVIGLGYWAGRSKKFDADQVQGINELVMTYALPALVFVAASSTTRRVLFEQGLFLLAVLIAFVGLYVVLAAFSVKALHHSLGAAGLQALLMTFPSVAFFGIPIFRGMFGETSVLSVALSAVLGNLTVAPLTIILLEIDAQRGASTRPHLYSAVKQGVVNSLKKPLVWAPVLGVLFALLDIQLPSEVEKMFSLIGSATGGVSLFLAGLILAAYHVKVSREVIGNVLGKMILQPAVMLFVVTWLAIPNPLGREAVLVCAIPSSPFAAMLAARYRVYESETASTLILTAAAMLVTYPLWIYLTGG
jgi:hypothetical protein